MNEENEGCVRGTAEQGEEAATENQTKKGGGGRMPEEEINFLGLGLFFFFCGQKCPPCLAENEGYL